MQENTQKLRLMTGASSELTERESRSDAIALARLGVICLELSLVMLVIYQYQLESRTFFHVMLLASGGFVVHALLPLPYRLPFFVALSFAGILIALGLLDGAAVIALGLLLIGICHLPFRLPTRVALLLVTATLFAFWRMELLPTPWSVAIWPVLAAMFMFRLALYLYALKHDEKRPTAARTLAYFFMLPNVCFPLFPVVDYSTFRSTYYDRDSYTTYTTGIRWIVRGLMHLILYRVVYVHLAGDARDVHSLGELVQFLLATFLLYLRVSGQFHLIIGVLHLYGFRLPETHHLYFLASSFTDFWRRINIYWKDFMMKLVYYPSFFKLKRFGSDVALVTATIVVFIATWLLHSYQWFWLRGGFPLDAQDGFFWGILGALVVVGAQREMKRSRARQRSQPKGWDISLACRTVGTFAAICVLWSLWSAESLATWLLMWTAVENTSAWEIIILTALFLGGLAIAGKAWSTGDANFSTASSTHSLPHITSLGVLVGMVLLGSRVFYEPAAPGVGSLIASVQRTTLNARDAELQHKGYYEKLDNTSRMSAQLWDVTAQKPPQWLPLVATDAYQLRRDTFLAGELRPNMRINFMDQPFTTNSWGMRDHERVLAKPAGVYRIALLGPSHVMGSGVADDETFARFLEDRLNRSIDATNGMRYEVLNFGIAGEALTQQLAALETRVVRFQPDAVFFTDSAGVLRPILNHILNYVARRPQIPFPRLQQLIEETGVSKLGAKGVPVLFDSGRAVLESLGVKTRMPWAEAEQRLRRSGDSLIEITLQEMSEIVKKHGAVPVFLGLDIVQQRPQAPVKLLRDAAGAGMLVFDLFDLWQGRDIESFRIHPSDNHPNPAGNRLIADRLFDLIQQHREPLRLHSDKSHGLL
jgi:D-alanyl-lipoteichoic acid acyltransferase DltB (MBOAT superfamily)